MPLDADAVTHPH